MGEETTRALHSAPRSRRREARRHLPNKRGAVATDDERFMNRALDLARVVPNTSPNPRVGAVVVRDGRILGEGFHLGAGHPHAEMAALDAIDASGGTLYVSLEPCNHQGHTPPCAEAIVSAGIRRVVAPLEDPDPRVSGAGFDQLRRMGVEVDIGLLAERARRLNAPFIKFCHTSRPLVTLKLALSLDGRMAAPDGSSRWITGPATRRSVHLRRLEADAVMVGSGTVAADDPLLTVRAVKAARQPMRVLVDSSGRTPPSAAIFGAEAATLVATTHRAPEHIRQAWDQRGAEVIVLPRAAQGVDLRALLEELGGRRVLDLYCEGGAALATSLLAEELVDVLEIHYGSRIVGAGGPQLEDIGVKSIDEAKTFDLVDVRSSGHDVIALYERESG
jgi:diaminohydroxyphosphoribosylaminopyrimidine deaminase/5-amino-6-(5-phosphoribosylamino)uracil reductase